MSDKQTRAQGDSNNRQKNPDQWVTGDEPMTGAQRAYLRSLCEEAKLEFDERLTKAQASKRIDELRAKAGRGKPATDDSETGGLIGPDPTGNPGSLGKKQQQSKPAGMPSSA